MHPVMGQLARPPSCCEVGRLVAEVGRKGEWTGRKREGRGGEREGNSEGMEGWTGTQDPQFSNQIDATVNT